MVGLSRLPALFVFAVVAHGQNYPEAAIGNGLIEAKLYLPDAEKGSYRATRFDWSGVIHSLRYMGHEYFGQWYRKHDPLTHDAITGPVNIFDTDGAGLGYKEAQPGGTFIRIGVGRVEKPDEPAYRGTFTYKVVDPGKWTIEKGKEWIEFRQELAALWGYGYVYTKRIRLMQDKPEMAISYKLQNTGPKAIDTTQFNHNMFVIDGQPSGPGFVARFPFEPRPMNDLAGLVEVRGHEIVFLKELQADERVLVQLEGYGATAGDHQFALENQKTGAGVKMSANKPLVRLIFWSRPHAVGPEPYIHLHVQPGQAEEWETRYLFYTLK